MTTQIFNQKCNGCYHPMVVDYAPRFTFNISGNVPLFMQVHIFCAQEQTAIWQSEIEPYSTCGIISDFAFKERTAYTYTITVIDGEKSTVTSDRGGFETGFFGTKFANARFIGASSIDAPIIYRTFSTDMAIVSARLYVATLGFSTLYMDGKPIGADVFSPVWSDYHPRNITDALYPISDEFSHSHYYKCYDVTDFISVGTHTLAVWLGNGWYHQDKRNVEGRMDYGTPKVKFSLYYQIGAKEYAIHSDEHCQYGDSPIIFNNVYYGEEFDADLRRDDLLTVPVNGGAVTVFDEIQSVCRGQLCPDDAIISVINPRICYTCGTYTLYDVGRNITGRPYLTVCAEKGSKVVLTFAEEWDGSHELNYQSAGGEGQIQTVIYHSNGQNEQHYSPQFTVYGFRYIKVEGSIQSLECYEIHANVARVGHLSTSSETLNRFVACYENSQLSNLHCGVPTDCPHRERLGYTGDGWVTANAACSLFDMEAFYMKWIQDIADSQCKRSGHVNHTAPFYGGGGGPGGWGGAIIFLPYILYGHYKNITLLDQYYDNMAHWLAYLADKSEDNCITKEEDGGWCLGDWCVPDTMKLSAPFVNTCMYALQLETMAKICTLLGKTIECERYMADRSHVQSAIIHHYKNADGSFDCGDQGAIAFAWKAGVADNADVTAVLERYSSDSIDTGIFGTPFLFEALFACGLCDIAIDLMEREHYPSFGWMFKHNATTLWESFDGNASHNHPMFGGTVGVFIDALMGLEGCSDGHFVFRPIVPKRLQSVSTQKRTVWGDIEMSWAKQDGEVTFDVSVPDGMTYTVVPE